MSSTSINLERYPLQRSPLYRLGRAVDLAMLLKLSPKQLKSLIVRRKGLYSFREQLIDTKQRSLAIPIRDMRSVHERLKRLFERIQLGEYIYSPRKGRSTIVNATLHEKSVRVVKLDIKQFYPSTTEEHVFQFFRYRMGMVDDVAGRLTKICTINGRVPFGSPLSPILCALVHDDVFSKVAEKCAVHEAQMSLWVDDVTISSSDVAVGIVRDVNRLLRAKRLIVHKAQRRAVNKGVVVTGIFLGSKGAAPANKLHTKSREKLLELNAPETDRQRKMELAGSLIGSANHALKIYPKNGAQYARAAARRAWLHSLRKDLRASLSSQTGRGYVVDDTLTDTSPWE
jgi:RNA-directed DNA polymerase